MTDQDASVGNIRSFDSKKKSLKGKSAKDPERSRDKESGKKIGSARGLETMFRNAYRTQLDLITLAATKANIMISVNGFITSMLVVSGAFVFTSDPLFIFPLAVFLFTSVTSIFFAILSAEPKTSNSNLNIEDFYDRKANILVFEDYARLDQKDYMKYMNQFMSDKQQIYQDMAAQLYWLGAMADRKFRYLHYSYRVLRWGTATSVLLLLGVTLHYYLSETANRLQTASVDTYAVFHFDNIYESSGAQQLPDGRILVVEDEKSRAFSVITATSDGVFDEQNLFDGSVPQAPRVKKTLAKVNDLEGVAIGQEGYIYAITSFSRNRKALRSPNREKLIRFKLQGDQITDLAVFGKLRESLDQATGWNKSVDLLDPDAGGLNIEALGFDRTKSRLMIGFRSPLVDNKAMIMTIDNPAAIFDQNAQPHIADQVAYLDLDGEGIRSLVYDSRLKGYLIASGAPGKRNKKLPSKLWFWDGDIDHEAREISAPGLSDLKNIEGVTPVTISGEREILVMSDDGKVRKHKPAHYMLFSYDTLEMQ